MNFLDIEGSGTSIFDKIMIKQLSLLQFHHGELTYYII